MSLLLGVVAAALYLIYRDPGASGASAMLQGMLFYIGFQNIALAIFNMLPGLPLDGGRVLQAVIWGLTGNRNFAARFAGRAGQVLAVGMMLLAAYMVFFSAEPNKRVVAILDRQLYPSRVHRRTATRQRR